MFPTLASLLEERLRTIGPRSTSWFTTLNEWLDEVWGLNYQNRIFTTPATTLPIVEKAIEELEWAVKRGARRILVVRRGSGLPRPAVVRATRVEPFWERVVEHDVLSACTPATAATPGTPPSGTVPARDAAVPDERDGSSTSGGRSRTGGFVGDPRRARPHSEVEVAIVEAGSSGLC